MARSYISNIAWPPVTDVQYQPLKSMLDQAIALETNSLDALEDGQLAQLQQLLRYAVAHSPYYRDVLKEISWEGARSLEALLQQLPILTRESLQNAEQQISCNAAPEDHHPLSVTQTSGSTGQPVVLRKSELTKFFWMVDTLREHLWWQRDFTLPMAVIKPALPEHPISLPNWGPPVSNVFPSGPSFGMSFSHTVEAQARWLANIKPAYLLSFPSNLSALLDACRTMPEGLSNIRQLRTLGETVTDELRAKVRTQLGVDIVDQYSSQEIGVGAIQCPHSGAYHTMATNLIVEVLNDNDQPCTSGEIGRLVITDLHNFITPLIRYEIGDYAEQGEPCDCGRTLPTLKRILGRRRNMLRLPDGQRIWPRVGFAHFREIAPVQQFQVVQVSVTELTLKVRVPRSLTDEEKSGLVNIVNRALNSQFAIHIEATEFPLPGSKTGKFEEFVSYC